MAYDLSDYNTTYYGKAGQNSQTILNKYPYLCSRPALIEALGSVAQGSVTQRNPNGYTAEQMADKIIQRFDEIMYDTWHNPTTYNPKSLYGPINEGYRWDQSYFWDSYGVHFIFHNGDGAGLGSFIVANIDDIILWPKTYYQVNTAEFKEKPFLGFDNTMLKSEFGAELDMDGGLVTGITVGGTQTDDGDNPIGSDLHKSLMYVYNSDYYHPTFQPNGFDASYWSGSTPADWNTFPSSKRYDQSIAKFEVTVSGGVVTAITGVARLDGDGNSVTGGFGYSTGYEHQELQFKGDISVSSSTQIKPRILYRAHIDQSGYTGNKATVNLTDPTTEFYEGKNLTDGTYDAWAVYGAGDKGYAYATDDPGTSFDNWYDINLPTHILPKSVRVINERPLLKSTTRSLKQITVGTGAHRIGLEFEYPPMTKDEADDYIAFFEKAKGGAKECQIYIPYMVMPHIENLFYNVDVDVAASFLWITGGKSIGSDVLTLSGLQPGYNAGYYMNNRHFTYDNKIYRITAASTVDNYGRTAVRIEPPLVSAIGSTIRARTTYQSRSDFFLVKAQLVDDTLDYTVDAAGLYRISFKFVEAME